MTTDTPEQRRRDLIRGRVMGLEAAWAEAETADPNFEVCELRKRGDRWVATAWATDGRPWGFLTPIDDDYASPVEALRALAVMLRAGRAVG